MASSERRETSAASQPASGNATPGVRTMRSASARGDLADAPDADLDPVDERAPFPPDGNVAIARRAWDAGANVEGVILREAVPAGHKVALGDVSPGEPVVRYGAAIGRASQAIYGACSRSRATTVSATSRWPRARGCWSL